MADILIKNMELPLEERIQLSIYPNGLVVNHSTLKIEKNRTTAIELPEHHGRLGDLDVIRKKLSEDCPCRGCENYREEGVCMQCQWDRFVELIDNAPTIVEASNADN